MMQLATPSCFLLGTLGTSGDTASTVGLRRPQTWGHGGDIGDKIGDTISNHTYEPAETIRNTDNHLSKKRVVFGLSRYAYRAGPLTLNDKAHSAPFPRRFFMPAAFVMAAGFGHPSGWPVPCPVLATHCQPSPNQPLTDGDGFQTYKESVMSVTQSLGEIRPICPISDALDLHQLNKALITAEAVACLLDSAVRQPANVSRERLRVMADSLRSAAGSLDAAGRSTTAGVLS